MALVSTEHDPQARGRAFRVYLQHAIAGILVVAAVTVLRAHETRSIVESLGSGGPILIALLVLFAVVLAQLLFPLTEQTSVSLVISAYIAIFPLLGAVLSAWIAVLAAMSRRLLAMAHIGPTKFDMRDPALEWVRTFALFGTYGIPVTAATLAYQALGGTIPQMTASVSAAGRIALCGALLILLNNLIVTRIELAYGYPFMTIMKLGAIDASIYVITIPYAILTVFAYGSIGWGGVLAAAFTGVLANAVGRKLAMMRSDREQLIQRLASLTTIGKSISLSYSIDDLLDTIYTECGKVIDVSIFSIALVDTKTNELMFELNVEQRERVPKSRWPIGEGLNSWVVTNGRPLLLGSSREEQKFGIVSIDDGIPTESWLGVPMIARHHVIGVISVQSYEKNVFRVDDLVLLTAIANQAAVAIENAQLYKDLEGLNLVLEHRVHERTNELREANLHLVAADRSKNQFLASMSHELRTPLNAIIGFSSILIESARGALQPRLYRFLENIHTAGSHLLDLINDILDLAKIESGKLDLRFETFELRDTIATVERVIKGMAAERHVSVITSIDENVGSVHLDEGRLKQILLNLLSNAVKFSHDAGFVYLNVRSEADSIRIDVMDTGTGIAATELPRIFDEFYQVNDGGRRQKGTGLGLSLTKNFVEMHHGRISVKSEPGQGSTFTILLPRDARVPVTPRTPVILRRGDAEGPGS
jgi:signal transduction histidine kinase